MHESDIVYAWALNRARPHSDMDQRGIATEIKQPRSLLSTHWLPWHCCCAAKHANDADSFGPEGADHSASYKPAAHDHHKGLRKKKGQDSARRGYDCSPSLQESQWHTICREPPALRYTRLRQ